MLVTPIIEDAWEHRHRRRSRRRRSMILAALLSAAILAAAGLALHDSGSGGPSGHPRAAAGLAAPSTVLSRLPYMGVRCGVANVVFCDRVGLAVWLKRPASSVTATIAGQPLALNDPPVSGPQALPRRVFDGDLQPARFMSWLRRRLPHGAHDQWYGADPPVPVVRLKVIDRGGRSVFTQVRVALSPGWG